MRETPWRILRKTALGLVACALALTWAQSGMTADCVVLRGQDPLDVLQVQVKQNVWIVLDTSGSMGGALPGFAGDKLDGAIFVLTRLMDEFVDASGQPLVNWGYVNFNLSPPNPRYDNVKACGAQFTGNQCTGLDLGGLIVPPACDGADNRQDILDALALTDDTGFTPNGISLDQVSNEIVNRGFVSGLLPNQKNFIIILTDGRDTCECEDSIWTPTPTPLYPSSDIIPSCLRGGDATSACSPAVSGTDDRQAVNAGTKGRLAYARLNPQPLDRATATMGSTFVVGLGLDTPDRARTNHLAWESSGAFYGNPSAQSALFADDLPGLFQAMRDALAKIGVPEAEVTLGSPIVGSVKELMNLTDATGVSGPLDFLASGGADFEVINKRNQLRNNILFTTSVELPDWRAHFRATNIFEVQADGTRTADFSGPVWDAGEELQARDPDDRQIFFNRAVPVGTVPPAPIPFTTTDVTALDLGVAAGFLGGSGGLDPTGVGAATDADAAAIVIGIIRGKRLVISSTTGFYTDATLTTLNLVEVDALGENTWKLYDITSAPAIVLAPPRSATNDPPAPAAEYRDFFDDHINRQTIAYLSSNGGMVHAFRADNGYEIYGYIPHDVLTRLQDFVRKIVSDTNGIANHEFFMATSPIVADAFLQPSVNGISEWRTVLSFGRGRGGKFVSAVDVSEVGEWDGQAPADVLPAGFQAPRLLFTVGNNDGVVDLDNSGDPDNNYDGMGETWSLPAMGRVRAANVEGQWVAFFGGGYGCTVTDEGKFFYVLKLEDGSIYAKLGPIEDVVGPGDAGIDENALVASPALYNPHEPGVNDGLDFITRAYIGDLQGFVYKLVAEDPDPTNWVFDVLFEVTSEADQSLGQGEHNQPITARASLVKPSTSTDVVVFVGTGGDRRVELAEPDRFKMVGILDTGTFDGQLFLNTDGPSFFDLPEGERVTVGPVTARNSATDGVVFFASSLLVIDLDLCAGLFTSTLTAIGVTGGLGAYDMDPSIVGVQGQVDLGAGKVQGLYHRDEHLYVSLSGGIGFPSETQVLGGDTFPTPPVGSSNLQLLVETFRMSPF